MTDERPPWLAWIASATWWISVIVTGFMLTVLAATVAPVLLATPLFIYFVSHRDSEL